MDGDVRRDVGGDTNGGCCCNDGDAVLKDWVKLEMCSDFQLPIHDILFRSDNSILEPWFYGHLLFSLE